MTYAQLSRPIDWFFLGEERELAIKALGSYCKGRMGGPPEGPRFSGAYFDQLADPDHPDRFMPTDLVAVTMLSVEVPAHAAIWILDAGQQELSQLLQEVGPDRDIWEATDEELADGSPAHRLWRVLQGLPGVGVVTAGKLLAAKRPSLIPIWDSHVAAALGPPKGHFWLAMRDSLRPSTALVADVAAEAEVDLPLLRIVDIVVWMRQHGYRSDPDLCDSWSPPTRHQ
jgi:hypothetical protein